MAFQPHLYSRTRDFAHEFAEVLSLADEVILLDIYPAREEPIPGVTSQIILEGIKDTDARIVSLDGLTDAVKAANPSLLLTAGAGNIVDKLPEIVKLFE